MAKEEIDSAVWYSKDAAKLDRSLVPVNSIENEKAIPISSISLCCFISAFRLRGKERHRPGQSFGTEIEVKTSSSSQHDRAKGSAASLI
jgi:hypothetical protein